MEEMSVPLKRKRVVLTLEQKLEVIKLKESGKSFYEIASKFNIGISTIKDLLKKRGQITDAVHKNKAFFSSRKTLREGNRPEIENLLYQFVCEKLEEDEIVTNNMILTKAAELTSEIMNELWKPSAGWLSKFKQRYNLTTVKEEYIENPPTSIETVKINSEAEENIVEDTIIISDCTENFEYPVETQEIQLNPLYAANYLLDFVTSNKFPLKEVISLRMIRDRIAEMQDLPVKDE